MQACKPGSVKVVFQQPGPTIYLPLTSQSGSISLPMAPVRIASRYSPGGGATYLAFQLVRFAVPSSLLLRRWSLTPPFHLFPPRQVGAGSLFSVALSVPFPTSRGRSFPLGSTMLCVARTFLHDIYRQGDRTACIAAKVAF
jgi:hypothetical protein